MAAAAAPFGIGGRTGVETERDAENFSSDVRCRMELDGLFGEPGESSSPFATTASIGRRGRLYKIVRLRVGGAKSGVTSDFCPPDRVGD